MAVYVFPNNSSTASAYTKDRTVATFLVELIGYLYRWSPNGTAGPKVPMHVAEGALYQVLLIAFSVFATRSIDIASKLGKPPAPAPAPEVPHMAGVAVVQEKV